MSADLNLGHVRLVKHQFALALCAFALSFQLYVRFIICLLEVQISCISVPSFISSIPRFHFRKWAPFPPTLFTSECMDDPYIFKSSIKDFAAFKENIVCRSIGLLRRYSPAMYVTTQKVMSEDEVWVAGGTERSDL